MDGPDGHLFADIESGRPCACLHSSDAEQEHPMVSAVFHSPSDASDAIRAS
ncbi:MAG: hypothetical protein RLZZ369_2165, partial [Pseudomonadota bacterium]